MIPLGLKSEYSLSESILKVEEIFTFGKLNNYKQIAIADSGNLFGLYKFLKLAKENDIRLVIGSELSFDFSKFSEHQYEMPFLLYPKNQKGYKNLLKLLRMKNYDDKKLTFKDLKEYGSEIIFISCGSRSPIYKLIPENYFAKRDDKKFTKDIKEQIAKRILFYKENIPNFYLGLSVDKYADLIYRADVIYDVSQKNRIKILPYHETRYLSKNEKAIYELFIKMDDKDNTLKESDDYSFWLKDVFNKNFSKYRLMRNLENFYSEIKFEPKYQMSSLPDILNKQSPILKLEQITNKALNNLNLSPSDKIKYQKRLNYELDVIKGKNLSNYFIIVYAILKYARNNNILVGPGRGSSVSSLVCYLLNITKIDPIKYNLYFERFLNFEKMELPDIDLDIQQDRREELINYTARLLGKDHIAQISTYEKFTQKTSLRDILSIMGNSENEIRQILKNKKDPIYQKAETDAKKLENVIKNYGTHPAGVIFTEDTTDSLFSVRKSSLDFMQIDLDIHDLENTNIIKTDFLGLKNLKIIQDVLDYIHQKDESFNLDKIPLDDKKTYKLLQESDTDSIFQLESDGIKAVLKRLKPKKFNDIINLLALYRPGPLKSIDLFISRKNGIPFKYASPRLENILKETYGIILFQEQIMQIAYEIAGYSLEKADDFRKVISKNEKEKIIQEEKIFIKGAIRKGLSKEEAEEIFKFVLEFSSYGFNKAHAAAYALFTYQMSYLKANYFTEFSLAILSNSLNDIEVTKHYLKRLKEKGVKLLPPCINQADLKYKIIKDNQIMLPLTLIRGFGEKTARAIISVRASGEFTSFANFRERTDNYLSATHIIKLIDSSSLDTFGKKKAELTSNLNSILSAYQSGLTLKDEKIEEHPFIELCRNEEKVYGFNIFYKKDDHLVKLAKKHKVMPITEIKNNQSGWYLAEVIQREDRMTRKGDPMAFVLVTDGITEYELVCFKECLDKLPYYANDEFGIFYIEVSRYGSGMSYIIKGIKTNKRFKNFDIGYFK